MDQKNLHNQTENKLNLLALLFQEGRISLGEISALTNTAEEKIKEMLIQNGLIKTSTILVCGGAGFLRSKFIQHLLEKNSQNKKIK